MGDLKFCHMSTDFFVFKQKIFVHFCGWRGWGKGVTKFDIFVTDVNLWPLNCLKLQPIQFLDAAVVSSSTSSYKPDSF